MSKHKLTRRALLLRSGWAGVGAVTLGPTLLSSCGGDSPPRFVCGDQPALAGEPPASQFRHGVASGDPLPDAVILWTRVTPSADGPVDVRWEVAVDRAFDEVVASGMVTTDASRDYTVKVDATGLAPDGTYYYRFEALGGRSLVGRTRTAPVGSIDSFRIALMSCSNYRTGWFHAYRRVSERLDLDAVVHVGDYIYEYGNGGGLRVVEPDHEIVTLEDYRTRYAHYRQDADLQAAHQMHPFICVWDDHESANNSWEGGAQNHDPATEGSWEERKAAAARAYAEWMPIREDGNDLRIWRSFQFGNVVELCMLDTRLWGRDEQTTSDMIPDPERELLGADQEAWLEERLSQTEARWKLLGQQVMMGQLNPTINLDQWDGYLAARQRFFDMLTRHSVQDVVVLTGDIHSSWAMDISSDPLDPTVYDPATGEGTLAVELVTPAVTSSGLELPDAILQGILDTNPHMRFVETSLRGYVVVDVRPDRVQADWYHLDGIGIDQGNEMLAASYATQSGESHLVAAEEPAAGECRGDPPAWIPDPQGV